MFEVLREVEAELPSLLQRDGWNSLRVTYELPEVERVWRQHGDYRILLHCIHPCEAWKPLFHPHPWPSIVKVLSGVYEMKLGYGAGLIEPARMTTLVAGAGTVYAMTDPNAWHSVRPLEKPSFSLMVTGRPWAREMPRADRPPQPKLDPERVEALLTMFATLLTGKCRE